MAAILSRPQCVKSISDGRSVDQVSKLNYCSQNNFDDISVKIELLHPIEFWWYFFQHNAVYTGYRHQCHILEKITFCALATNLFTFDRFRSHILISKCPCVVVLWWWDLFEIKRCIALSKHWNCHGKGSKISNGGESCFKKQQLMYKKLIYCKIWETTTAIVQFHNINR